MSDKTIYTFKRYEKKYVLTPEQFEGFMAVAGEHLVPSEHFEGEVLSIYYDSENYSLIRHSLEKPVYKEKLRLRSYGVPDENGTVFVELKKKYKGIVYKRRVEMTEKQAEDWLSGRAPAPMDTQITREIDWFLKMNRVMPRAFIGTDRTSWYDRDNAELRITFDRNIKWRDTELNLTAGDHGEILLKDGKVLMEIKIPDAAPMWLAELLSDEKIFPTSYSKYGTYYTDELLRRETIC